MERCMVCRVGGTADGRGNMNRRSSGLAESEGGGSRCSREVVRLCF